MDVQSAVGRRYSAAERRTWVTRYHKSSLTQGEFARRHKLNLGTFRGWLYRSAKASVDQRPLFQELVLPETLVRTPPVVEIAVGSEVTIRLGVRPSAKFLGQLVRHLRPSC